MVYMLSNIQLLHARHCSRHFANIYLFFCKTPKWGPVTGLPHRGGESAVDRSGDFPRSRTSLCWGAGCWGYALNYSFAFSPQNTRDAGSFPTNALLGQPVLEAKEILPFSSSPTFYLI